MKEVFDTVRTALKATGDWQYIDANDGQLDNTEEFSLLPSALIDFDTIEWTAGDENLHVGMMNFSVQYAFRRMANASNLSSDKSYQAVMGQFDIVKTASSSLIGKSGTMHGRIGRIRTERVVHKDFWIIKEGYSCTVAETFE